MDDTRHGLSTFARKDLRCMLDMITGEVDVKPAVRERIWTDDAMKRSIGQAVLCKKKRLEISRWRRMVELDENGRS